MVGEVGLHVQDRQPQHQDEAGQHEPEAREEAAELAASEPAEVDAQLVRLGPGEHLVDGQRLLEGVLVDPALLVDALALDHRDLRSGPAPGKRSELQEASEDGARRIAHRARQSAWLGRGRRTRRQPGKPSREPDVRRERVR